MCCPSTIVPRLRQAGRPRRAAPTSSRRPTTAGRRRPRCKGELEMFHRVGDVQPIPVDPGRRERLVQQLARRTHQRRAGLILLVAAARRPAGCPRSAIPPRTPFGWREDTGRSPCSPGRRRSGRPGCSCQGRSPPHFGLRRPVEKSGTQLALEALHLLTQGSLGHVFPLCSTAKVPFLGDRNEVLTKPKC